VETTTITTKGIPITVQNLIEKSKPGIGLALGEGAQLVHLDGVSSWVSSGLTTCILHLVSLTHDIALTEPCWHSLTSEILRENGTKPDCKEVHVATGNY
jgi:hypothetical protein